MSPTMLPPGDLLQQEHLSFRYVAIDTGAAFDLHLAFSHSCYPKVSVPSAAVDLPTLPQVAS